MTLGPDGKARIIHKPGERHCPDCTQEWIEPQEKHKKRLYAWAAVGYNFISDLIFYEVPASTNERISQQIYRDRILEGQVKRWLEAGHSFILEEDGDSGYSYKRCRAWKQAHGLRYQFNTQGSPDLSPIENAWRIPKQHIQQQTDWDVEDLKALAIEAWQELQAHPERVNGWVDSMPQRMKDVVELEGRITGW
ncbi:hypothetical protein HYQ44_008234 [Verticillium longisporum]|nr:hypothetical protein HYQ44_008234 [Verticillium longisporum]